MIPGSSCTLPTTIGAVTRILLTGVEAKEVRTISEEEGERFVIIYFYTRLFLPRCDDEVVFQKKEEENITRSYT